MIVTHIDGRSEFLTDYKSLQRKRRVNGEYSLSFLLIQTDRNQHSFPLTVEESIIDYEGQQYRIKKMSEKTIGNTPVKQIQADHIFFDLVDGFQYDTISGYKSLMVCLDHVLSGTGFAYSVVDVFSTVEFENFGNDNVLSLIQTCLGRFGAEVEINGKHLTFRKQIGRSTDIQFRFKHNIKAIEKFVDTSNLSTYIKGFGKQNEDGSYMVTAEYTSPMVDIYGIRHAKPIEDERYTTYEGLLERLQNDLQDIPSISYTLEAVELIKAGINTEQLELGDTIFTIYEPLSIDINARVVEIVDYPEEPTSSQLTIANFKPNITDNIADFQRTKDKIDGLLEGKTKLPMSSMDEAIKRATIELLEADTQLSFENGIMAIDPDNPNYVTLYTSKGFGISKNGGLSFDEAITANGFNLSAGVIGFLDANNIKADTLSAISADLGTVTAGSLIGVVIKTAESDLAPRIVMENDKLIAQKGKSYIELDSSADSGFNVGYPRLTLFTEGANGQGRIGKAPNGELDISNDFYDIYITAPKVNMGTELTAIQFRCYNNATVQGDFSVQGTKNASVPTSIGLVNISAYETAEYYFGDIGRDEVLNGVCNIEIESLFKETVNTDIDYEVFLTPYGKGLIYVDEMTPDYFVIKGDDIPFAYEIKAKRKDYETVRLELTHESEVSK